MPIKYRGCFERGPNFSFLCAALKVLEKYTNKELWPHPGYVQGIASLYLYPRFLQTKRAAQKDDSAFGILGHETKPLLWAHMSVNIIDIEI